MSKITELKYLRDELLQLDSHRLTITTFGITATFAALGLGIRSPGYNSYVMLAPLVFLFFAGIQILSLCRSTVRIASYIRQNIELSDPSLSWETHMQAYRDNRSSPRLFKRLSWPSQNTLLVSAGWLCILLSLLCALGIGEETSTVQLSPRVIPTLVLAAAWLGFSVWICRMMRIIVSDKADEEMDAFWSETGRIIKEGKAENGRPGTAGAMSHTVPSKTGEPHASSRWPSLVLIALAAGIGLWTVRRNSRRISSSD